MKTGYFAKHASIPGAISIARSCPKFFEGPSYKILAPTWPMLKMDRKEYDQKYLASLKRLDAGKVFDALTVLAGGNEPILLCWEATNKWCHRRLVAEWLELLLKIEVTEYGIPREELIAYKHLQK